MSRAVAALLGALVSASALAGCAMREPVDLPAPESFEAQLLDEINALRIGVGAPRLQADSCMAGHARDRAATLPGAESAPREDLPADCGDFDYAGENVSRSELTPGQVVSTWAEDDLQYPNLVDEGFTHAGVGCVGVSFEDSNRPADLDEELAGMACSVVFQGPGQAEALG
ncbi:CAP domain-containing protein [Demequina aestuarii]|uniref:CAP domain-containing protein n=1 Tax=Demequina aestuarii TaxID=327095 RepID=UPI000781B086|nr:CAP domain-containing protein [Demequina aestuarii]